MTPAPLISVVIPTCRRPDLLARCLDRLAPGAQTLSADQYEVTVTDDGVPTVELLLAEKYPWARWTAGPRRGPAANRNHGARQARGEWVAFTDDDCVPDVAWLSNFGAFVQEGYWVYEGATTCAAGIHSPLDQAPVNITGGCLWSCNVFIRRAIFEEVGGFDEEFPYPYMEDADLRERLVYAGHTCKFIPTAVVDHPPRRQAPGWRLARYHESWVYHWYKSGRRTLAAPRLLVVITQARMKTILQHPLRFHTVLALGSFISEICGLILRLPFWEWKYRPRFLTTALQ